MSRNKCFFQIRMSHVLRFISIYNISTDCPTYTFRWRQFTRLISGALYLVREPLYPMNMRLGLLQSLFQQNGGLYQESKHDSPVRNQSPNRPSHLRGSEKTMRIFSQIQGVSDEIRSAYPPPTIKIIGMWPCKLAAAVTLLIREMSGSRPLRDTETNLAEGFLL
jgi:hypothetical protein